MRTRGALGIATALTAACLLWAAPSALAAGESFKVLQVNATGCNSGNLAFLVERANLDGGSYIVRTVVTVDGLIYMNESASISSNGQTGWNLFNNFSYDPVPNPGTWPIPENRRVSIDFTLERPKGTILFAWSTVVDGCNTGKILFSASSTELSHRTVTIWKVRPGPDKKIANVSTTPFGKFAVEREPLPGRYYATAKPLLLPLLGETLLETSPRLRLTP